MRKMIPRQSSSSSWLLVVAVLLVLCGIVVEQVDNNVVVEAFHHLSSTTSLTSSSTTNPRRNGFLSPKTTTTSTMLWSTSESKKSKSSSKKEEGISEMDARVLQEMLQSEKLDLKTEQDMKKLLERGVVAKDKPEAPPKKKDDKPASDSEFRSEVFQKLSDTKLWQKLSAKAEDWFESVGLTVQNAVERSVMTAAALGLFAWERAVRDVGRALPSAGNTTTNTYQPKRPTFLLSDTSQFEENNNLLTRESMTTPMDEIKSVGEAIGEILKTGKSNAEATTASGGSDAADNVGGTRSLRTAATSRSDKQNFQRAYERRTLQLEVEKNPTRSIIGGATDTAYQVQRELQVESNVPGYKTAQVQNALEAATNSTRQLLAGARVGFLEGAKQTWRLQQEKQRNLLVEEDQQEEAAESTAAAAELTNKRVDAVDATVVAATATTVEEPQPQPQQPQVSRLEMEAQQRQQQQELERRQQQQLRNQNLVKQWQGEIEVECLRLKDCLQNCIVNPEETWLQMDFFSTTGEVVHMDQSLIRQIVTEMIDTRNNLKELIPKLQQQAGNSDSGTTTATTMMKETLQELIEIRSMVEEIQNQAEQAVSVGASKALGDILLLKQENKRTPILYRLEDIQSQLVQMLEQEQPVEQEEPTATTTVNGAAATATAEVAGSSSPFDFFFGGRGNGQEGPAPTTTTQSSSSWDDQVASTTTSATTTPDEAPTTTEDVMIEPEILDVIPEAFVAAVATVPLDGTTTTTTSSSKSSSSSSSSSGVQVELVTDDDFEAAVGSFDNTKKAVAVTEQDDMDQQLDEEGKEPTEDSVLIKLLLRTFDILFLILEKTFTVALPAALSSGSVAKDRLDDVRRGGLGSEGWKRIENAKDGAKRY